MIYKLIGWHGEKEGGREWKREERLFEVEEEADDLSEVQNQILRKFMKNEGEMPRNGGGRDDKNEGSLGKRQIYWKGLVTIGQIRKKMG